MKKKRYNSQAQYICQQISPLNSVKIVRVVTLFSLSLWFYWLYIIGKQLLIHKHQDSVQAYKAERPKQTRACIILLVLNYIIFWAVPILFRINYLDHQFVFSQFQFAHCHPVIFSINWISFRIQIVWIQDSPSLMCRSIGVVFSEWINSYRFVEMPELSKVSQLWCGRRRQSNVRLVSSETFLL